MGRKRGPGAQDDVEKRVTDRIVTATYSYWTIGYLLRGRAAKILLDEEPLKKLVPVDEYLPIMYGAHKGKLYTKVNKNRDLPGDFDVLLRGFFSELYSKSTIVFLRRN